MKIFMVAFCADKKATFSPTKRQLTKRLLVAFSSVAFEPVYLINLFVDVDDAKEIFYL